MHSGTMWSGVEHDVPQELGSKVGPGMSAFHQIIISNNSYAHDEQGDNHGQEKREFDGVLCNL